MPREFGGLHTSAPMIVTSGAATKGGKARTSTPLQRWFVGSRAAVAMRGGACGRTHPTGDSLAHAPTPTREGLRARARIGARGFRRMSACDGVRRTCNAMRPVAHARVLAQRSRGGASACADRLARECSAVGSEGKTTTRPNRAPGASFDTNIQ